MIRSNHLQSLAEGAALRALDQRRVDARLGVEPVRLYESYLINFSFTNGE